MLAIMHTAVRRDIFVSVLLLSVLGTCVSEEQEQSCPKIYSTLTPLQLDAWWMVGDFANDRGTRKVQEAGDISSRMNRSINDSKVNSSETDRDGSRIGDSVESEFEWKVARNISDQVLGGRVPPDKWTGDRREAEGVEGTEEGRVEERKDGKNEAGVSVLSPELNLAHRMMSALPPFVPSSSQRVTNEQCIKDSQLYLQELRNFAVWALKMHDASAKLPSGLLNGNVNQYGDIDQCLQVRSPWQGPVIKGRYCLTTMALRLSDPHNQLLSHIHQLLQAHDIVRSELDDPGHRVPRYSAIHWALCVPASCNASDVQVALSDTLQRHTEGTGFGFNVRVTDDMCQTEDDRLHLPNSTIIVGALFIILVGLAAVATVCDTTWRAVDQTLSTGRKWVQAFSLRKNVSALFSLSRSPDDIESLHGVRAFSVLLLLVAHKAMALLFNPYLNRTTMAEGQAGRLLAPIDPEDGDIMILQNFRNYLPDDSDLGQPWTSFARGACIHTDPFLMISGLLTSYSFYKELERTKRLDIPREYVSRLMRLVPNLVALILFCTFILPWAGTGPLWNQVVKHHSDVCKDTWWRNLLFVHNYFGFEKMCLTHTHHLGIDTQLFALSPLLVYMVWKWPRTGMSVLTGLAAISTALRYNVTASRHLSHYVLYGISIRQLFETADLSYSLPAHRATVYIMGIALGFVFRYCGREFRLKKVHLTLGWTAAIICFYMSIISPAHMAGQQYVYNTRDAANFGAFAPIFWCLFVAWIIFVSYIGQAGLLNRVLSWRGFLVTTRLSYALYLTQFPVFFYFVGKNRVIQSHNMFLLVDVPEMVVLVTACVLLTVLVDLPFQNIRNILLRKPK